MERVIISLNCFSIWVRGGMSMDLRMLKGMRSSAMRPSGVGTSSISVCSGISSRGTSCVQPQRPINGRGRLKNYQPWCILYKATKPAQNCACSGVSSLGHIMHKAAGAPIQIVAKTRIYHGEKHSSKHDKWLTASGTFMK